MGNSLIRQPIRGKVRELSLPRALKKDLVVWWYGGIKKNTRASSVPYATVFFRELDSNDIPGKTIQIPIGLTSLGLLRIGSIWREGVCRSEAILRTEEFHVDFTHGEWSFVSPWLGWQNGSDNPIDQNLYPLHFEHDKNWLIEFTADNDKRILIPCLEFFSRCYGRSAEVNRVLATYPWDEAQNRLYAPLDQPALPNQWSVKLARRMCNGDVTFLAHVLYDDYARRAAKSIYAQIESVFQSNNKISFPKVGPWFQGPARLLLKGLWTDGGKTFLGLQIAGCSDPGGVPIIRDRENTNKVAKAAEGDNVNEAWDGMSRRVINKPPDVIDLTGDDEPDQGSVTVDVEEPDFIVLGEPRVIIDVRRDKAKSRNGKSGKDDESEKFSGGEPSGTGKGTGSASVSARPVMESKGALRDVWNALLHLKNTRPELVQSVEWFTFEDGFSDKPEPRLIALESFAEDIVTDTANWSFYDVVGKIPRGALVARVRACGKLVYIVEIQRRPRKKTGDGGELKVSEESYKGLVFVLDDQSEFEPWLKLLLLEIRFVKGIVQRLVRKCPGKAAAFKHASAGNEQVPCESAVLNALKKVGLGT